MPKFQSEEDGIVLAKEGIIDGRGLFTWKGHKYNFAQKPIRRECESISTSFIALYLEKYITGISILECSS